MQPGGGINGMKAILPRHCEPRSGVAIRNTFLSEKQLAVLAFSFL